MHFLGKFSKIRNKNFAYEILRDHPKYNAKEKKKMQ